MIFLDGSIGLHQDEMSGQSLTLIAASLYFVLEILIRGSRQCIRSLIMNTIQKLKTSLLKNLLHFPSRIMKIPLKCGIKRI